jgi:hypothetical protein
VWCNLWTINYFFYFHLLFHHSNKFVCILLAKYVVLWAVAAGSVPRRAVSARKQRRQAGLNSRMRFWKLGSARVALRACPPALSQPGRRCYWARGQNWCTTGEPKFVRVPIWSQINSRCSHIGPWAYRERRHLTPRWKNAPGPAWQSHIHPKTLPSPTSNPSKQLPPPMRRPSQAFLLVHWPKEVAL